MFPYAVSCVHCRTPLASIADPNDPTCSTFISLDGRNATPNSSGQRGEAAPPETRKLCWGALNPLLTPFWCMANSMPSGGLLLIVGLVGIGYPLALLLNVFAAIGLFVTGGPMAWRSRKFADLDQFRQVQRVWGIWALALALVTGVLIALVLSSG